MPALAETHRKPREEEGVSGEASSMLKAGQVALLSTLLEALSSEMGGEVVAKYQTYTARIYVFKGRVAWATASTLSRPLGRHLIESKLISEGDLSAAVSECKRTGANFAETLVSWGLIGMDSLRSVILQHVAEGLLQPFSWPSLVTMFVPSSRTYAGKVVFEFGEVLRTAAAIDSDRHTAVPWLVEQMGDGDAIAALQEFVEARHPRAAAPVPAAQPAPGQVSAKKPTVVPTPSTDTAQSQAIVERVNEQFRRPPGIQSCRATGVVALRDGAHLANRQEGQDIDLDVLSEQARQLLELATTKPSESGWAPLDILLETPQGSLLIHRVETSPIGEIGLFMLFGSETRYGLLRLQLDRIMPDILETLR